MIFPTQHQLNSCFLFLFFGFIAGFIYLIYFLIFYKIFHKKLIKTILFAVFYLFFCIFFIILINFFNFGKFSFLLISLYFASFTYFKHTLFKSFVFLKKKCYNLINKTKKHKLNNQTEV